jgi:hypothetical protein
MTRRRRVQPRRSGACGLAANAELTAVGYRGWWQEDGADRRTWWQGIATVHGARLRAKWIEAFPGTRPAFDWIVRLPAWELLREPDTFDGSRAVIEVGGVRYWFCGPPWQVPQVDVLRSVGEVDAGEFFRHREWIKAGASGAYRMDEGWDCEWIAAGAIGNEVLL